LRKRLFEIRSSFSIALEEADFATEKTDTPKVTTVKNSLYLIAF
jgi:hypothetical protein